MFLDIKNLFGYKDKVPVMSVSVPAAKIVKKEDKKGKGKRTHEEVEPEDIPAPAIVVLDYENNTIE